MTKYHRQFEDLAKKIFQEDGIRVDSATFYWSEDRSIPARPFFVHEVELTSTYKGLAE